MKSSLRCVGLDLSLAGTGLASWSSTELRPETSFRFETKPTDGDTVDRTLMVRDRVCAFVKDTDLAIVEGVAWNAPQGRGLGAAAGWVTRAGLRERGVRFMEVAPASLKKFVTGKGNATKDEMRRVVGRAWRVCSDDDQADAVALAAFGAVLVQLCAPGRGLQPAGPFSCLQIEAVTRYLQAHESAKAQIHALLGHY